MNSDLFFILKVGFGQLLSKNWPLSSLQTWPPRSWPPPLHLPFETNFLKGNMNNCTHL